MIYIKYIILGAWLVTLISGCEKTSSDREFDTELTEDQVYKNFTRVMNLGYNVYSFIPDGFNSIDGAYRAGATDDGEHSLDGSNIRLFNEGSLTPFLNPDNVWDNMYKGIRAANLFLENSENIDDFLVKDTYTATDKVAYERNKLDVSLMRAEVKFLRAYFYFELLKRYGGIPIITTVLDPREGLKYKRSAIDETFSFILSECDSVSENVIPSFRNFNNTREGRVTQGTVLAFKARVLLYRASPLFNTSNDIRKWQEAAKGANDVIALGYYKLESSYRELFLPPNSFRGVEVIWSKRYGETNFVEKANYPSTTDGGQSGTCPTQNLVDEYEKQSGWDSSNPYENRDPRLKATIVTNNSMWNGRNMEIFNGGREGISNRLANTTKTGYYLKKFLVDNLDISQNQTAVRSWIILRYGEVLLNYAEAMNEAFGPATKPSGYTLSALEALNMIRERGGISSIEEGSQEELREIIQHERRIELAFEGHRFWDVRRWEKAEKLFNQPVFRMSIDKVNDTTFSYRVELIENRVFENRMYFYPIPQNELIKYNNEMTQNPGW